MWDVIACNSPGNGELGIHEGIQVLSTGILPPLPGGRLLVSQRPPSDPGAIRGVAPSAGGLLLLARPSGPETQIRRFQRSGA